MLESEIFDQIRKKVQAHKNMELVSPHYPHVMMVDGVITSESNPLALLEIKRSLDISLVQKALYQIINSLNYCKTQYGIITDGKYAILIDFDTVKSYDILFNLLKSIPRKSIDAVLTKIKRAAFTLRELEREEIEQINKKVLQLLDTIGTSNDETDRSLSYLPEKSDLKDARITNNGVILLPAKYEDAFFRYIIGRVKDTTICRYTTLSSLIRIIDSKKNSVCSITCMNDKSECYYFDEYVEGNGANKRIYLQSTKELKELNKYFILSCSKKSSFDKLTMWRMYADDAKGVCLKFEVDTGLLNEDFYLAPISYASSKNNHKELDIIKELINTDFEGSKIVLQRSSVWSHFFKPAEYSDEKEIRLLYTGNDTSKYKWITTNEHIYCPVVEFNISKDNNEFPLVLSSVMLGPKCYEKETNAGQLKLRIESQKLGILSNAEIDVNISSIDSYR